MSNDPKKFKTGIAVTGTATVGGDNITTNTAAQTLVNKTIDADSNTITNIDNADIKVGAAIDAAKIHDGSVSNTEFGYLNGVTSPIQTQLDNNATGLSNHLADSIDAHDASAISNVPAGNLAATDVQTALNELQSDIDTRALDVDVIKKNGSVAFTAAQSMGGFKITSLAAGTASSDAVNKGQLDAALEGLKPKTAVRVATTTNIIISTDLNAGDVIDGVTLADGDRVLVKDQSTASQNGIYVVSATPTRSTDFDSLSPIDEINGSLVAVQQGSTNAGKVYVQTGTVTVLNTDPINFVFFNSSASLVGGDGVTVSGSNISVDHNGEGLTFVATQLALELDGSTLSKSATGVKVADGGITNTQVNASAAIAYSKLNLSNSIANADIASTAAIDATKIADGSVTNAEFQYLGGVTSDLQTQLNGKASTTLNNLGTTAANASINPGSANLALGQNSNTLSWRYVFAREYYSKNNGYFQFQDTLENPIFELRTSSVAQSLPSGADTNVYLNSFNNTTNRRLAIFSPNDVNANANPTDSLNFETGNKTAGTGNSGSITLQTGTSIGGVRGDVILKGRQVDVDNKKIVNVANPTNAQDAATKAYVDAAVSGNGSPGDIAETVFALANNQPTPVNVTGFAFANATVRSFKALVSVQIDATTDRFEVFELLGVQRGADWSMSVSSTGDDSQVAFSITNAGQVQYTSANYAGFVAGAIKFRAETTSI